MISASLEKLFCMSAVSCRSPHPQPFSTPPAGRRPPGHCPSTRASHPLPHCRMKAISSAAPPSIPLSSSCCRAMRSLVLCVSGPPPQPLSALSRWEGPAASLGQLLLPFIHTTPLLPVGMEFPPALPSSHRLCQPVLAHP